MIKITKKNLLLFTMIIVVIVAVFFVIKANFFNHRISEINSIVVRAHHNSCTASFYKKNYVLVITDPKKIRQYSWLLLYNLQEEDPCGDYDYNIKFLIDNEVYKELETDKDGYQFLFFSDSVKRLLNGMNQQYQSNTELGFNEYFLKIPVNHEPVELIAKLKKNNIKTFIEQNPNWRYPSIKIQSKYYGEDNVKVEQLAIKAAETKLSDFLASSDIVLIHKNTPDIGMQSYHQHRVNIETYNWLYFPLGTDLSSITPQLIQAGFSILKQNNPDYYYLTLIDKREASEIKQFIEPLCQGCLVLLDYGKELADFY